METMYFVSWYIHNKTEDAWNAVIVDQYSDLSAAKKAYQQASKTEVPLKSSIFIWIRRIEVLKESCLSLQKRVLVANRSWL